MSFLAFFMFVLLLFKRHLSQSAKASAVKRKGCCRMAQKTSYSLSRCRRRNGGSG